MDQRITSTYFDRHALYLWAFKISMYSTFSICYNQKIFLPSTGIGQNVYFNLAILEQCSHGSSQFLNYNSLNKRDKGGGASRLSKDWWRNKNLFKPPPLSCFIRKEMIQAEFPSLPTRKKNVTKKKCVRFIFLSLCLSLSFLLPVWVVGLLQWGIFNLLVLLLPSP